MVLVEGVATRHRIKRTTVMRVTGARMTARSTVCAVSSVYNVQEEERNTEPIGDLFLTTDLAVLLHVISSGRYTVVHGDAFSF